MTADTPRLRLGIIGIVAISLFASLFTRLYFLQVLAGPEYKVAAETNRIRRITEPAPRGRILDAQGRVLVDNRAMVVVTVDREELGELPRRDQQDVLARLSQVIGVPVPDIEATLADQRFSPFTPVPVAEDVPLDTKIYLREHNRDFPSVDVKTLSVRIYPEGPVAAHLLGYVGEINEEELEAREDDGYELGDHVGKSGVEQVYEEDLRGEPGEIVLEVDAKGRVLQELNRRNPTQGHDIQLTIDLDVQRLAEARLAEGLEAARKRRFERRENFRARAGSVVVQDSRTGALVAMASFPSYDPAQFVNGISTEEYAVLTDPANGTPFNNWAIQGEYAPGSTFKLITGAAALATGLITPQTTIVDRGVYRVPECGGESCTFRNAGSTPYGPVDIRRAMTVSSDVFFYSLGNDFWTRRGDLGETPIQDTATAFGFGVPTGVPLASEGDGRVMTPEVFRQRYEESPDKFSHGNWFVGENINLAIGQGEMLVTPLQLANAYTTFANGGTRYVPAVAKAVLNQNGSVVRELQPAVAGHVELPPHVRDPLLAGLKGVTTDPKGTAVNAFDGFPHDQIPVAGKTGTAQVGPKQDTALFAAFAPADNPRYTIAVVMEESGFGSAAAAPVARALFGQLFSVEDVGRVETVIGGRG